MAIRRWIEVHVQFEAIHAWLNAPSEGHYLRHPHRHLFFVTVRMEVTHENREVEFYVFRKWLQQKIASMDKPTNYSCESFSDAIADIIILQYPNRRLQIRVAEDNLEGSVCEYDDN